MIISFSVANFRSFSDEQTISLVASKRLSQSHEDHAVPIPGSTERVLGSGVLYGANGAGKSNLFKALSYVRSLVSEPRGKSAGTGREPFRLAAQSSSPSSFDLQFVAGGRLYRYGFKVTDHSVTEEWLLRVAGGKERPIYERTTDNDGTVNIEAAGLKSPSEKLAAMVTVGGPQNQLFLATIGSNLNAAELTGDLIAVIGWFNRLVLIAPDDEFVALGERLVEVVCQRLVVK